MGYNANRSSMAHHRKIQFVEETNYGRLQPILPKNKIRVPCDKCKQIVITDPTIRGEIIDRKWICDVCISKLHEREYCDDRCFKRPDYKFEEEFQSFCSIPNHENCIKIYPLNDIREMDSHGKFGYPERYLQIRDFR